MCISPHHMGHMIWATAREIDLSSFLDGLSNIIKDAMRSGNILDYKNCLFEGNEVEIRVSYEA